MILRVRPEHFPFLVVAVLDVAWETDLDFDWSTLSSLRPRDGLIDIDGPGAPAARSLVAERLERNNVRLMAETDLLAV